MNITWVHFVAIFAAGALSGFINSMAGGGSFISLAALGFAGLPGAVANATNRVAVQVQGLMSVLGFHSKGVSDIRQSVQLAVPITLGAIVGAYLVVDIPDALFRRVLAVAMILMLLSLVFDLRKYVKAPSGPMSLRRRLAGYLVFFAVGVYGGAIQAGVGFLILAAVVGVSGLNLVHSAGHKVFVTTVYTFFVLVLFAAHGQVDWGLGFVLAVGEGLGAWVGSRQAAARGEKLVRAVLIGMLAIMALGYLGVIPGF